MNEKGGYLVMIDDEDSCAHVVIKIGEHYVFDQHTKQKQNPRKNPRQIS